MSILVGQVVEDRTSSYQVVQVIKDPTIFQARVVPFTTSPSLKPPQLRANIKACTVAV